MMTFTNILGQYRRWKGVQDTIRQLNRLNDNELNDLGIGRWRIREIAQNSIR